MPDRDEHATSRSTGAMTAPVADAVRMVLSSIARTFPHHIPVYVCAFLFCTATYAITILYKINLEASAGLFFLGMVAQFLFLGFGCLALFEFIVLIRSSFPDRPLLLIGKAIAARLLAADRSGNMFHSLATLTPLMASFAAMKDQIPKIHPFAWDLTFAKWDRLLGGGRMPWEILQPWFGHSWITAGLNFVYTAWFMLMFGVLFWQSFSSRSSVLRTQYLLAFSFAWFIGGNLLATVFSSAGPCFYGLLHPGSPDPYAAQLAYLHAAAAQWPRWTVPMQDVLVQKLLWTSYISHDGTLGGISAMPSMHVISSVLMAIVAWRVDRRWGIAIAVFAGLIVIGSIHLAWHYAVDGIAGILLAFVFWTAAGMIARANLRLISAFHSHSAPLGATELPVAQA